MKIRRKVQERDTSPVKRVTAVRFRPPSPVVTYDGVVQWQHTKNALFEYVSV